MYVYKKTAADNSVSHFHERASEQPKSCFLFTFSSLASLCHSLHLQWDNPNPTTTPGEWHHQDTTPNISWKNERLDQVLFTLKTSFIFIFFQGKVANRNVLPTAVSLVEAAVAGRRGDWEISMSMDAPRENTVHMCTCAYFKTKGIWSFDDSMDCLG